MTRTALIALALLVGTSPAFAKHHHHHGDPHPRHKGHHHVALHRRIVGQPEKLKPASIFLLMFNPKTAIYDISTHTVTLPNGELLEAHSGVGSDRDNPSGIADKNRGSTPPGLYYLVPREAPFHGVHALRLEPADGHPMHGRDGILAHSYMLDPNGSSNGCVVFRDYPVFLAAYQRGEIDKILVIDGVTHDPAQVAQSEAP